MGQQVTKSEVFFSRNLSDAEKKNLSIIMGERHVLVTGTYLSLPFMVGRRKSRIRVCQR
jgi:hypothetical protein